MSLPCYSMANEGILLYTTRIFEEDFNMIPNDYSDVNEIRGISSRRLPF